MYNGNTIDIIILDIATEFKCMKKKLIVATALIVLIAVCLTLFVGCDEIIKKNEERDAMQVVATVNYNGQTAKLYKYELEAQFANSAYIYTQYYGLSYQAAADAVLRSMAQQKLLAMYAKERVAKLMDLDGVPSDIMTMLTKSEQNHAIENANETLYSGLKGLIETAITDDNYNKGSGSSKPATDDEDIKITDPVRVRFYVNGGSSVDTPVRVQKGHAVKEPTAPTKEGYTFYGWYQDSNFSGEEFDFETTLNNDINLYARWEKYVAPRTEIPEEEEADDYDPKDDTVELSPKFFSEEYQSKLYEKFADEKELVETIKVSSDKLESTLRKYIEDNMEKLETNLKKNLHKSTKEQCYNYYLDSQVDSVLIAKLERLIGEKAEVSKEDVKAEFDRIVEQNMQNFDHGSDSAYSGALTSTLDQTYYHTSTEDSYGFVINILLKLDEDSLKILTNSYQADPRNTEGLLITRNRLMSQIKVKVSNPVYDSKAIVKGDDDSEIELRDPMTDAKNPYNDVNKTPNTKYQKEGGNNYNQLVSFEVDGDGNASIVFGATEHPAMAYLLNSWPAFDVDGKVGVIHQIHNSFDQVKEAVKLGKISKTEGVYWLRKVATTWLYLVGDDTGAVTDSSNNNGLGYLITPEGKDSSYLEAFTAYARKLIANGTGSYSVGEVTDEAFKGAATDGNLAGDGVAFVVADTFINSASSSSDLSNAYAGVFVLLNSYTVWDDVFYNEYTKSETNPDGKHLPTSTGVLPLDYIVNTFAKDKDDIKTLYEVIEESLLASTRSNMYSLEVNTMGLENMDNIVYNKKAYESLWKQYDN